VFGVLLFSFPDMMRQANMAVPALLASQSLGVSGGHHCG
jgi:hypothetical protein